LSEYKHRDYFKFLAALPPADHEFHTNASKEMSAEVQAEEKKVSSFHSSKQQSSYYICSTFIVRRHNNHNSITIP
jgi:hypothetical protein